MEEQWKSVKNYEGLYEISNRGRIKTLERIYYSGKNHSVAKLQEESIKHTRLSSNGYETVSLQKGSIYKGYSVHKLVWLHFGDRECPPELQLDHINGVKTDNRIENLQLLTPKANRRKSIKRDLPIGVILHGNKYQAQITKYGKGHFLGLFNTPEEAHAKYLDAEANL